MQINAIQLQLTMQFTLEEACQIADDIEHHSNEYPLATVSATFRDRIFELREKFRTTL